jgi:hypothetical protein
MCEQEETINHLSACVYARQCRRRLLSWSNLQDVTPTPENVDFYLWWQLCCTRLSTAAQRGFNTLVAVGDVHSH